jgi:hypothetical protein
MTKSNRAALSFDGREILQPTSSHKHDGQASQAVDMAEHDLAEDVVPNFGIPSFCWCDQRAAKRCKRCTAQCCHFGAHHNSQGISSTQLNCPLRGQMRSAEGTGVLKGGVLYITDQQFAGRSRSLAAVTSTCQACVKLMFSAPLGLNLYFSFLPVCPSLKRGHDQAGHDRPPGYEASMRIQSAGYRYLLVTLIFALC